MKVRSLLICNKKEALSELLKDFSVNRNLRRAGVRHESIPAALNSGQTTLPALPRSALTEVWGPESCGKTSLMHTFFAQATRSEACALIDACDGFDPVSAQSCGVDLENLLWIRCGGRIEAALKATDILLQGGGFGLTALDLCDVPRSGLRKIPMMYWYRFRRAVESSPAAFLVIAPEHLTGSCAAMVMAGTNGKPQWSGTGAFTVLQALHPRFEITRSEGSPGARQFSVHLKQAST